MGGEPPVEPRMGGCTSGKTSDRILKGNTLEGRKKCATLDEFVHERSDVRD